MTKALRKSGGLAALTWAGSNPDLRLPELCEQLSERRFRLIDNAASEEVSIGWVTPADPTGNSFTPEDLDAGEHFWLRMRIDRKAMPRAVIENHLAAEEHARGKRLAPRERRELKQDLAEKLLPRVLPSTTHVDMLLMPDRELLLVLASSNAAREEAARLWSETFAGCPVEGLGPGELAEAAKFSAAALNKATPTRWPGGGSGDSPKQTKIDIDTTFGFLGEEFLLWLWHQWETNGGEFDLARGRRVGIALDDLLVFSACFDETVYTLRDGMPTRSAAARAALREGHRLARAKLIVAEGSEQWTCTLDGARMTLAAVRLPAGPRAASGSSGPSGARAPGRARPGGIRGAPGRTSCTSVGPSRP